MAAEVYVFGYQSMLAQGSLASSIGAHAAQAEFVPAQLRGHRRDWSAVRDFSQHTNKRYVHVRDWQPAQRVAFANLRPHAAGSVNGVCHRVPADVLDELDFREQGYTRRDVTGLVQPYPGHTLDGELPCFAYVDLAPSDEPSPVSQAYYDMGWRGAQALDAVVPGFSAEYLASTQQPAWLDPGLAFLYLSADARHLWLLNEPDSSLVLLLHLQQAQFGSTVSGAGPELARPVTAGLEWLDERHRQRPSHLHPRVPPALAQVLTQPLDAQERAQAWACSPWWLCRLAATQLAELTPQALWLLGTDPDPWVARAARLRAEGSK